MTFFVQICNEAEYCSHERKSTNIVLKEICGSYRIVYRNNNIEGGLFPSLSDCEYQCRHGNDWIYRQSCQTIAGPGAGKPCIFPFKWGGKVHNNCTLEYSRIYWCSTMVDENGQHVLGHEGHCSLGCPGVEYEGYKEEKCDTEEQGIQCTFPFTFMGFTYHGCIKTKEEKYWCKVKDEKTPKGFRRVKCSKSCLTDVALSEELSPNKIAEKLKTIPIVSSMVERDRDCLDYMASYNMTKVGQRQKSALASFSCKMQLRK